MGRARSRAGNMAELGLGGGYAGGGGYEGESDDSSFQAALEVFAKLKVLRGPGSCPGAAGSGRRGCSSRWRLCRGEARRPSVSAPWAAPGFHFAVSRARA